MSITCPVCSATSHHPIDEQTGYCPRCHRFTGCLDPSVCNYPNGRCVEPSRCEYPKAARV